MVVDNDVRRDPRVQKEARSLVARGYRVAVIGRTYQRDDTAWEDFPGGFRVRRVFVVDRQKELERVSLETRQSIKTALHRLAPRVYGPTMKLYRRARGIPERPSSPPPAPEVSSPPQPPEPPRPPTIEEIHSWYMGSLDTHDRIQQQLAEAIALTRPEVVHAHDLDVLESGAWAARATGAALVYDAHEIWWQQHAEGQVPKGWIDFHRDLEHRLIKEADRVITVCDSIARFLAEAHSVPTPVVVRNAIEVPPGGFFSPDRIHPTGAPIEVLFHGGFGLHRGLEELIASVETWRGARLILRGFGDTQAELVRLIDESGLTERVVFEAPVPMSEVVTAASRSDVGVIPYKPVCLNNRFSTPNKLFEYLSGGLAIAASDLPEIRRVVDSERVGALFDPDDPKSISEAVNRLAADRDELHRMRQRAVECTRDRLSWAQESKALLAVYAELFPRPLGAKVLKLSRSAASLVWAKVRAS